MAVPTPHLQQFHAQLQPFYEWLSPDSDAHIDFVKKALSKHEENKAYCATVLSILHFITAVKTEEDAQSFDTKALAALARTLPSHFGNQGKFSAAEWNAFQRDYPDLFKKFQPNPLIKDVKRAASTALFLVAFWMLLEEGILIYNTLFPHTPLRQILIHWPSTGDPYYFQPATLLSTLSHADAGTLLLVTAAIMLLITATYYLVSGLEKYGDRNRINNRLEAPCGDALKKAGLFGITGDSSDEEPATSHTKNAARANQAL